MYGLVAQHACGPQLSHHPVTTWLTGSALPRRFFFFWLVMFLVHQMAVAMFRLMGAIGRTLVVATTLGSTLVLAIVTMSGFVLAYPQARPLHMPLHLRTSRDVVLLPRRYLGELLTSCFQTSGVQLSSMPPCAA